MYCLSVYLIQIQSYRAFSKIAVDHWCLSLTIAFIQFNHGNRTQRPTVSLGNLNEWLITKNGKLVGLVRLWYY